MLSIIIPTDPDEKNSLFQKTLDCLPKSFDLEIIFVNKAEAKTRAERLNIGFHKSKGNLILFHHPRSFVEEEGILFLIDLSKERKSELTWGGFTHKFDLSHYLLKFTSWYSNSIRSKRKGILYLDHCIFFNRVMWKNDLPAIEIFEDTVLSFNLRKYGLPRILPFISKTSAIRFQKNGIWKQCIMNQFLKLGFYLKMNSFSMNKIYEKGIELN